MESIYNRVKVGNVWKFERVEEGQGKHTAHLTPPFYARPWKDGKQRWHRLNAETFAAAKKEAEKLDAALTADAMGLTVAEAENIGNRVPLAVAVRRFMEETSVDFELGDLTGRPARVGTDGHPHVAARRRSEVDRDRVAAHSLEDGIQVVAAGEAGADVDLIGDAVLDRVAALAG